MFCHLCKEGARAEKETKSSAHHRHRGPEGAPVDLAEEGESEDETDLTDLVARKHPGCLLKQNIMLIQILHIPQTFDRIPNCFSMVDRTAER